MKHRYIFYPVALIVFSLFFAKDTLGSHAMGSDITYECLGQDTFLITVSFYRDCAGIGAPKTIRVQYSSDSCSTGNSFLTLSRIPGMSGEEVSPICDSLISLSSCNGGSVYPGVELYTYSGILILPQRCSDWIVGYSECCRNGLADNVQNASSFDLYAFATINNKIGCNNSPLFTTLPVPYVCAGKPFNYNHGAVDIDGDSLVYRMIQPLDDYQVAIAYNTGYTINYPMSTTTGTFDFDVTTGQMSFTPDQQQVAVLAVVVEEYRNGVLIGTTMRDIQIVVVDGSLCSVPPDLSPVTNLNGGGIFDSTRIQVCPNTQLTFDITAIDPDGNDVILTSNASSAIPGSNFTVSPIGSSVTGTFSWNPTVADTGFHPFQVTYADNGCPISSPQTVTFTINVFNRVIIKPTTLVYCGIPHQLEAIGGSFFLWSPRDGLNDPTIANPLASPTVPTMYYAQSDCGVDSVFIDVQPGYNLDVVNDTGICRNQTIQLDATVSQGYEPYTFKWTPAAGLTNPNIRNPFATPLTTTTYQLETTSSLGCVREDEVTVTVTGFAPKVTSSATPDTVCPGESVRLDLQTSPGSCGVNASPCVSSIDNFEFITGSDWTGLGTPYEGQYSRGRVQYLYRSYELNNLGITGGTIKEISFRVATRASTQPYNNFTIKMGCTDLTAITSFEGGLEIVYDAKPYSVASGWNTHVLDNPYDWDGVSNLLVEICFTNSSSSGEDQIYYTPVLFNSVVYDFGNSGLGCALSSPQFGRNRADIRLGLCIPSLATSTISWTPSNNFLDPPNIQSPLTRVFGPTTFTATVNQGGCVGIGSAVVNVDTSFTVTAGPDTSLCVPTPVQLFTNISGTLTPVQLVCGTNGTSTSAPTTYDFGTYQGDAISPGPYNGNWENARLQFLIRKTELDNANITRGILTELAFNITNKESIGPFNNFTIKMGCSNLITMPTDFVNGLDVVFTPKSVVTAAGWNNYTFDNAYDWDGFSNIMVELCFENTGTVRDDVIAVTTTPFNSSLHAWGSFVPGCSIETTTTPPSQINLISSRPMIRLGVSPPPIGNLTYSWTPTTDLNNPTAANPISTTSVTTTYDLVVSDGNCVATDQVTIIYYSSYDANVFGTNIGCNGTSDGNAVSLPQGGVAPYDFVWNTTQTVSGVNSDTLFDLAAGTYTVTITDNNGCLANDSVTIIVPPPLEVTMDSTNVSCHGGRDGTTTATGIGGTPPYNYLWSHGDDSSTAIFLRAGVYTATVIDASGCVIQDSIEIFSPLPISLTLDSTAATCFGASDGTASVTAQGGVPPYQYSWNDDQITTTAVGLAAGVYLVIVTDNNDCIEGGFIEVLQPSGFSISTQVVDATCFGGIDGRAMAEVSGDTVNYSFSWSTGQITALVTGLDSGTVTVTATDTMNCSASTDVTIGHPDDIQVSFTNFNISCFGGSDGSVIASVAVGGTAPYSYSWSNNQVGDTVDNLPPGEVVVLVTDSFQCMKYDTTILTQPSSLALAQTTTLVSCYDGSDGSIAASVTGGNAPYNYSWSDGQITQIAVNLSIDSFYAFTVTDANDCEDSLSNIVITQPDALIVNQIDITSTCPGDETGRIVADASGGSAPYLFTLHDELSAPDGDFRGLAAGDYRLIITDQNGCGPIDTPLAIVPYDSVYVVFNPDVLEIRLNEDTLLQADIIPVNSEYNYFWEPATGLSCTDCANPIASPMLTTRYQLVVTDEYGCSYSSAITIEVKNDLILWVPNAFSPNGDGNNDFLHVYGLSVERVIFRVYDRWGTKLFETTNPEEGWNGTFRGKVLPPDVYVYYVNAIFEDKQEKAIKGSVTILK